MGWRTKLGAVLIATGIVFTVIMVFAVVIPANVEYSTKFGSDIEMATEGSTTLTGPNSIQTYVLTIWQNMNETFDTRNYAHIYNSPWSWDQRPVNSMLQQNAYFDSLNQSIVQRQALVNSAIEKGNYLVDPIQTAVNQTRQEMNSYGGLDWVLHDAWFLQFASLAYWSGLYVIIAWIIIVAACVLFLITSDHY